MINGLLKESLIREMIKSMKTKLVAVAMATFLGLGSLTAFSQCKEINWPTDGAIKAKTEEAKVLYEDYQRAGEFKKAEVPLNWLLANTTKFHSSLYINGAEIFDKLAAAEKDPARKKIYVDSLMIVYDMRITSCGEEASVTNRKALSFIKYNSSALPAESLALLDKAFELNGNSIMDGTIVPYFQIVSLNVRKLKNIPEPQIMERYEKLMKIIDAKIQVAQSKGQDVSKYTKMKTDVDNMLTQIVVVNCDFVRKNLGPKFEANPADLETADKIFRFMLKDKCTEDPLWLKAAEAIHNDPNRPKDCGLAENLGKIYYAKENYVRAEELLKEALTICKENADKGEILLALGAVESKKGNRPGARDLYRQSMAADAAQAKEVYERIGDLYYQSADQCARKVSLAEDRFVYLIAADYYSKAGNSRKVGLAKQAFPSKEEIFLVNINAGDVKTVGCWIGEATTVRTRD